MKKRLLFATILLLGFVAFTHSKNEDSIDPFSTTDKGVVIDGIRWATRNVAMPGFFVANPEDAGMFYQWNSGRAWNTTDERAEEGWNRRTSASAEWELENDPCPTGWRMPTVDELRSLRNAGNKWAIKNGVNGRLFGNAPNQIFLPAVGTRFGRNGTLANVGLWSGYWSASGFIQRFAFSRTRSSGFVLIFSSDFATIGTFYGARGFSVRCVAAY